jgi:hypothetical protein
MKRDKKLSDISKDATNAPQKMTLNKNEISSISEYPV